MEANTLRKRNEIAAITELIEKADQAGEKLGRTQLMKFLFMLKAVKGVPLNYNFSLYTYGPFDSEVLDDLAYAEQLGAIRSQVEVFPKGYQYRFSIGEKAKTILDSNADFLGKYSKIFEWVLGEFGHRDASELEMVSTLLFVDMAASERKDKISRDQLVSKVTDIKPNIPRKKIEEAVLALQGKGMIAAT